MILNQEKNSKSAVFESECCTSSCIMRKHSLSRFWVGEPFVGLPVSQCREEEASINRRSLQHTHTHIYIHLKRQQLLKTKVYCSSYTVAVCSHRFLNRKKKCTATKKKVIITSVVLHQKYSLRGIKKKQCDGVW